MSADLGRTEVLLELDATEFERCINRLARPIKALISAGFFTEEEAISLADRWAGGYIDKYAVACPD